MISHHNDPCLVVAVVTLEQAVRCSYLLCARNLSGFRELRLDKVSLPSSTTLTFYFPAGMMSLGSQEYEALNGLLPLVETLE